MGLYHPKGSRYENEEASPSAHDTSCKGNDVMPGEGAKPGNESRVSV